MPIIDSKTGKVKKDYTLVILISNKVYSPTPACHPRETNTQIKDA